VLLRHLFREFFSASGLSFLTRARVSLITCLNFLYFISPIDIIPEAILGIFGYLDDLIFILITLLHFASLYRQIVRNRTRV
jgi:RING finger protein 170